MPRFTRPDEPLNCRNVIVFDQRSAGYSFGEIECKAIYDEKFDAA